MTSESSNSPEGRSAPERAQTLALQGPLNLIMRGLLRAPLISRGIGGRLITIYVVGRKSGKHYAIPVAYTRHGGALLVGTPFAWGRNLQTGAPVDIRLKGKRLTAEVDVLTEETGVIEHYAIMARDNHNFAKLNKVAIDENGDPNPADLHLAWADGARVFRLTPR